MRAHGELRRSRRPDQGLANRVKKAVLTHLVGRPCGSTMREIAKAIHVWPDRILCLLRRYERLDLIRVRRLAWRAMIWEITPVVGQSLRGWTEIRRGDARFPARVFGAQHEQVFTTYSLGGQSPTALAATGRADLVGPSFVCDFCWYGKESRPKLKCDTLGCQSL